MSDDVFHWVVSVGVLLAGVAMVWQAVVLAAIYRAGKEAAKAGREAQEKFAPVMRRLDTILADSTAVMTATNKILDDNRTRVAAITAETLAIASSFRSHTDKVGDLIDYAGDRARARITQVDETIDHTVESVEQASDAVRTAVMKPVKEVSGLMAGVKAALNTYAQGGTRNSPEHVTQDEEMFI
jgi:uncharacterized protein YoxC